jgi:hypothetical protein
MIVKKADLHLPAKSNNPKHERLDMTTNTNIRPRLSTILAATALVLAGFSLSAYADDLKFKLSGDQEVPPVSSAATGNASITVKPDMSVSGSVTTSGIAGSMAHIHTGKAGSNGPVVVTLEKNGDNGWTVPAGTKLSDAAYQSYKSGDLYINVHSADHKPGEIRGQLVPPKASSGY